MTKHNQSGPRIETYTQKKTKLRQTQPGLVLFYNNWWANGSDPVFDAQSLQTALIQRHCWMTGRQAGRLSLSSEYTMRQHHRITHSIMWIPTLSHFCLTWSTSIYPLYLITTYCPPRRCSHCLCSSNSSRPSCLPAATIVNATHCLRLLICMVS